MVFQQRNIHHGRRGSLPLTFRGFNMGATSENPSEAVVVIYLEEGRALSSSC
jgi:hypothetical protein